MAVFLGFLIFIAGWIMQVRTARTEKVSYPDVSYPDDETVTVGTSGAADPR